MMPSPVVALFGLSVLQTRFESFATAIIPQRLFYTKTGQIVKAAFQNLVLGINDIYLPPIMPALYIFSGCLAIVVWWLLRGVVFVVASFTYLAGFNPSPPAAASGIGRKVAYLGLTMFVSAVPSVILPHHVMALLALLFQLFKCVASRIIVWTHSVRATKEISDRSSPTLNQDSLFCSETNSTKSKLLFKRSDPSTGNGSKRRQIDSLHRASKKIKHTKSNHDEKLVLLEDDTGVIDLTLSPS